MTFKAAITTTSTYGGLNAARAAVKNASIEVEVAEHKLRADEAVLKQAQVDASTTGAVVAADQQILLRAQAKPDDEPWTGQVAISTSPRDSEPK